jgi:hypothetical protein
MKWEFNAMVKWGSIAAVLGAAVLIFDFISGTVGIFDFAKRLMPAPDPRVNMRVVEAPGGGACLEFAFHDLSQGFKLGEIVLKVKRAEGPKTLAGDAAAKIVTRKVNKLVPLSIFRPNPPDITFPARIAATSEQDAAYVDFCPILSRAGTGGSIWVEPSFRAVDSSPLSDLIVTVDGRAVPEDGLPISLTRPKFVDVDETEEFAGIIKR